MEFTRDKLENLKKAHKEAKEQGLTVFTFEGAELVTDYAYYVIQYLEQRFESKDSV